MKIFEKTKKVQGDRTIKRYKFCGISLFKKDYSSKKKKYKLFGIPVFYKKVKRKNNSTSYIDNINFIKTKFYGKDFVILTPMHTIYLANKIKEKLNNVGINSLIINKKPKEGYENKLHIVICPNVFNDMPSIYIAYQMEQSVSNRWFNDSYFNKLKSSVAIFDYSIRNLEFLQKNGISFNQLFYVPVFDNNVLFSNKRFNYDVLFYGDVNSKHRRDILNRLSKKFKVKIVSNLFGKDLYNEIRHSKIIINIHYYKNALLETTRIFEALSLGKIVLSEKAKNLDEYPELIDVVEFFDNYDELELLIKKYINDDDKFKSKIQSNSRKLNNSFDKFEFFFYRALLSFDFISFDQFYYSIGYKLKLPKNYICLSMDETIDRRNYFKSINIDKAFIFSGLRHYIGWVGCGLSYKYLFRLARDQEFNKIIICEDDVIYKDNHNENFSKIMMYLNNCNDWDIFAGVIADLNVDAKIKKIVNGEFKFVYLDKMVSTVFNIYNRSIFDKLTSWDPYYRDPVRNTIDRYIERSTKISVITLDEFLVGHNSYLSSSLWQQCNNVYDPMIERSQLMLLGKIVKYESSFDKSKNC